MTRYNLIQSLITEIRRLRSENMTLQNELTNANNYVEDTRERADHWQNVYEEETQRLRDQNRREERQREYERQEEQSRQWEREDLVKKLDRAREYGDQWTEERVMRQLKNL